MADSNSPDLANSPTSPQHHAPVTELARDLRLFDVTMVGVGAMIGLLLVNWSRDRRSNEAIFAGGSLVACIGLLGLSVSTSFGLSLAALVVSGIGQAGFSIMQSSIILVEASEEMRSRAMGALVLAIGSGPLGRIQGGAMAVMWGAPVAVGAMAMSAALGIVVVAWRLRGFLPSSEVRQR